MTKKVLFSLFTILVVAFLLEIILQITSFTLIVENQGSNSIQSEDRSKFKILTLGESTTADIYGEGVVGSWPRHLEKNLNEAGISTKVYNPAAPGIYTGYMREELPDYLESFEPDLVVAMIGVNDINYLSYIPKSKTERTLNKIKIYALFKWIMRSASDSLYIFKDLILEDKDYKSVQAFSKNKMTTFEDITSYEAEAIDYKMFLRGVIELCYFPDTQFCPGTDKNYELANKLVSYFLKKFPGNRMLFDTAISYYNMSNQEPKCVEAGINYIKQGYDMGPRNLNSMGYCLAYVADRKCVKFGENCDERRKFIKNMQEYVPRFNGDTLMLRQNVTAMIQEIQAKNIPIIFMQYPTLDLKDLVTKLGIEGRSDLYLLENKQDFVEALKSKDYFEVFNDKFAGSWGHTTEFGHKLIGDNLFQYIMTNKSEFLVNE